MILLGEHRLICGDCRDAATVARLLDGRAINVAFTSPPYAKQRDYDKTSGFTPIPSDAYVDWYADAAACIKEHLTSDGSYFLNIKEHTEDGQRVLYVKDLTLAHVRAWGWLFLDEFCWQHQGFPGAYVGRFKNEWEPVFHYALQGGAGLAFNAPASDFPYNPHMDIFLGPAGGDVRGGATGGGSIPGVGDDPQARPGNVVRVHNSGAHGYKAGGASFPVALPGFFIDAFSRPGDVIYDPFLGSGTTLIAAHTAGRIGYGCEISPAYCDVICQRFEDLTGIAPVRP